MNNTDPTALPPKKPLALPQCRQILRIQAFTFLILAGFVAMQLHERHWWFAAFLAFGLLGSALIFSALWKQYQSVKNGAIVYSATQQHPFLMPQIVSIVVVFVLTLFVGLCSAFIIFLAISYFNTQLGWTVCGVSLLAVWVFIGYCWYRIITEKPQVKPEVFQVQSEGVWPPTPVVTTEGDKP